MPYRIDDTADGVGGRTFRLRSKGLPNADGRGDLYVSFDVQLPADDDGDLAALMRRMKASV